MHGSTWDMTLSRLGLVIKCKIMLALAECQTASTSRVYCHEHDTCSSPAWAWAQRGRVGNWTADYSVPVTRSVRAQPKTWPATARLLAHGRSLSASFAEYVQPARASFKMTLHGLAHA